MTAPTGNPARSLIFGGVIPLVVYSLVEYYGGIVWGLVAGMAIGIGEIVFERVRHGKVELVTWIANGMILGLGVVSLVTQDGIWFKLQPALLEAGFGFLLVGSVVAGQPFLLLMMRKQGMLKNVRPEFEARFQSAFRGITWRMGLFFFAHAILATWAAFHWTTAQWALLKGAGFTGSFILYTLLEILTLRHHLK